MQEPQLDQSRDRLVKGTAIHESNLTPIGPHVLIFAFFVASGASLATHGTSLAAAGATASIASIEHTEFFEALRRHVVMGFLASPAWGGNRNKAGWKLIGFDDAGAFQPPFGYYDTPENME